MKFEDLQTWYNEAESAHAKLFAEQRSNILLVNGLHYQRANSKFWSRVREDNNLTEKQRLRLTKNHIQKITKIYTNNILTHAPGVAIVPKNPSELQDEKSAQLNRGVWDDIKIRHKIRSKTRRWAKDYVEVGEEVVLVRWNPNAGKFLGYHQSVGESGEPLFDENGQPVPDENSPAFQGDFEFETVFAANFLTDPRATSEDERKLVCVRKMALVKDLKRQFAGQPDKLELITSTPDKTHRVFDAQQGAYVEVSEQCMIWEFFHKPCAEYPQGYYWITTETGVLFEGELPQGIWPVHYVGFDEPTTYDRAYSIIKPIRPYQAEINRASSYVAEIQISCGKPKVLLQNGTGNISPGGQAEGITAVKVPAGGQIEIMQGLTGDNYAPYIEGQIAEMYSVANVVEDSEEKITGDGDPWGQLYRRMRDKKKFVVYAEKFEEFLVAITDTALRYAKAYYDENRIVPIVGRNEMVNIAEFKASNDLAYSIKIEPADDDIDSLMGRQLTLNHLLQFVGSNLEPEQVAQFAKQMPFVNKDELFEDLTIDYENANNDILALERGEIVEAQMEDNNEYMLKRLSRRMKQADFVFLPDPIKQNYARLKEQHNQMFVQKQEQAQAAKDGWIPTGGGLIGCDMKWPVNGDPTKMRRLHFPYEALSWLAKRLETQGMTQEAMDQMSLNQQADAARLGYGSSLAMPNLPSPAMQAAGFYTPEASQPMAPQVFA